MTVEHLLRAALMNALTASALAALAAGLSLILSKRPAVVHCLWLIVLAKLVSPPLFEAPLGPFKMEPEAVRIQVVAETEPPPLVAKPGLIDESPELPPLESSPVVVTKSEEHILTPAGWVIPWRALVLVWLVGVAVSTSITAVRVFRFQRLLNDAKPAESSVDAEIAKLAARMGLKRRPRAVMVEGRLAPLLWAVGRDPRLVLPRTLWERLTDRQRTLLLAHELAHWKRGDHRVRYLELLATAAYWWLPVVWWVRRALRDVEEQCCDAWVVWMFPDEARTYAETLLDALDFLNPAADPEPLLASGFGKAAHLRRRLVMVMKGTTPRSLGWTGSLGAVALAGILLPIGPIWAQRDDSPKYFEYREELGTRQPDEKIRFTTAQADGHLTETTVKALERKPPEPMRIKISYSAFNNAREKAIAGMVAGLSARAKELMEKENATDAQKNWAKTANAAVEKLEDLAESPQKEGSFPFEGGMIVLSGPPNRAPSKNESIKSGSKVKADPREIEATRKRARELWTQILDRERRIKEENARQEEMVKEYAELVHRLDEMRSEPTRDPERDHPNPDPRAMQLLPPPAAAKDQDRLEQLENKLSKVLEELESLKKQKTEAGDRR